jgi:hypothetical protein
MTDREKAQRFYDALKRIAEGYQTPDELREDSEDDFGCDYEDALEMSYENLQFEAANAIEGIERPA